MAHHDTTAAEDQVTAELAAALGPIELTEAEAAAFSALMSEPEPPEGLRSLMHRYGVEVLRRRTTR